VSWDAPTTGLPVPTKAPEACFSDQMWQQIQNQPPTSLPAGISGRLLLETNTGQLMPQLTVLGPDGSQRKEIAIGGWSALSPDGSTVAFIKSNGPSLFLADVTSGEVRPVPNSTPEDYSPVWSPDGQWLAFVRSLEGIYVIHPDGSGLKQVTGYTGVPSVVGFLPDNRRLVVTVLGAGGSQVRAVDIHTGQVQDLFTIDSAKGGFALLSPEGTHLAFAEMTFGMTSYGIYVAALDGSDKRLVAGMDLNGIGISVNAWSPDGKWLALTVMQFSGGQETETPVLLNLETCQAYPLPGLSGRVASWSAPQP
jgi:Tol biopolymer transport system component